MKSKAGKTILNKLEKRIIDISYKHKLSHIASCLSVVRMIDVTFQLKQPDDIFILSNGHAGLALYVVLEKFTGVDAEYLYKKHGTHPNRNLGDGIVASSGSLGHGIGIGVGMALSNRKRDVYVLISDGECAEGSVWEALRIASENKLENLKVMCNANGYGAYGKIDTDWLDMRLVQTFPVITHKTNMFEGPEFLQGLKGHYHQMTEEEYDQL
jgi:transketolase